MVIKMELRIVNTTKIFFFSNEMFFSI